MNVANLFQVAGEPASEIVGELLHPMGVEGLYARSGAYETVFEAINGLISRMRDPKAEVFRFPPVMSRKQLEKSGYLASFPNLLGCVCALHGTESAVRAAVECFDDGGDWTTALSAADLVLSPAACYPVYPIAAKRGPVPDEGLLFDVASDCFRREPSKDIDRLQSFRMREFVRIGSRQQAQSFRDEWIGRALAMAESLGLDCRIAPANDPFFGRGGELMAASQRLQSLKFELLVPIHSTARPTACVSFNCHLDHFGDVWELATADRSTAHTACVAFGLDRIAVALFRAHGNDLEAWPAKARNTLGL